MINFDNYTNENKTEYNSKWPYIPDHSDNLDQSHLFKRKFKHNFQDCLNPLFLCGNKIETTTHYLFYCPAYTNEILPLLNKVERINCSILESSDAAVTKTLVFGDNILSNSSNTIILNSTIEYIISTQRTEGSILTPV